jgi:ribosomal protein S18
MLKFIMEERDFIKNKEDKEEMKERSAQSLLKESFCTEDQLASLNITRINRNKNKKRHEYRKINLLIKRSRLLGLLPYTHKNIVVI